MARIVLELLGAGGVVFRHDLDAGPLRIGRDPGNEIALTDPEVSSHHAVIAQVGHRRALTDLRSTNGTSLNGVRVTRTADLRDGDVIGLGSSVQMSLTLARQREGPPPTLVLEDRTAGVFHTHLDRPVRFGAVELELLTHDAAAARIRVAGDELEQSLDEAFQLAGRTLVFRMSSLSATTRRAGTGCYPYTVNTGLNGPLGPFARFEDPTTGKTHELRAENRSVLTFVLGTGLSDARARDGDAGGWCEDDRLRTGIWGATAHEHLQNNLNVLINRTRKELVDAGFDGSCIQRIHGHTRLWVDHVELA